MFGALADLVRKRAGPDRKRPRLAPTIADSFPKAWEWVTTLAALTVVMTGRQAGKTTHIKLRAALIAMTRHGSKQIYVTLTRKNAKKYFWQPIQLELRRRGVEFTANQTDMRLVTEDGSVIEAVAAEDSASINRIRGDNWDEVYIDEAQAYRDEVLRELIGDVIFPLLMTRGGRCHLLGTPPDSIVTYFVECLKLPNWLWFNWSIFDNRFVPRALVEETITKLALVEGSNQYNREILGLPVKDPTRLVFEYEEDRNSYVEGSIDFTQPGWRFTAGVDLGWHDLTSVHVAGYRSDDPEQKLYEVFNWTKQNALLDDTQPVIAMVKRTWKPRRWVGDRASGSDYTLLETMTARLGVVFERKPGPGELITSIGIMNTDLRHGRIKLIRGGETAKDTDKVVWSFDRNNKRVPNAKGFHSDRLDSFRYAHHAARHFMGKAPPPELSYTEERIKRLDAQVEQDQGGEW